MSGPKFLLIACIIILSLSVGYIRDRKKKLIALIGLGVVLAFYVVLTQTG